MVPSRVINPMINLKQKKNKIKDCKFTGNHLASREGCQLSGRLAIRHLLSLQVVALVNVGTENCPLARVRGASRAHH
jgi:hypothetical protein